MDIEQLKLIIQAVQGLGVEAKEGLIWYLLIDKIPGFIIGIGVIWLLYAIISKLLKTFKEQDDDARTLKDLRRLFDAGSEGSITVNERNRILEKAQFLAKFHKESTEAKTEKK